MFKKILIANRGEIALRIIRACREMDIKTVAVFSQADQKSLHVKLADEAIDIGPPLSRKSYLNGDKILRAAQDTGAEAVHPGYGFLSENAKFAQACAAAGIIFIGPSAACIAEVGNKAHARKAAQKLDIPVIPGSPGVIASPEQAFESAQQVGYPVIVKAAGGGGGRGMRIARDKNELSQAIQMASGEARVAFGNPNLYLEKYIDKPRHIEIQILGDHFGNYVYLGERECSIQKRYQKLIEESPSPFVDSILRKQLGETAVMLAASIGYTNAGTMEFLVDQDQKFYFMEVNARLQVEHPVTEMVTGMDIVKEQIRMAAGKKLALTQKEISINGWAMECRINAQDPADNFMPSPGTVERLNLPGGPGVRVDTYLTAGCDVPPFYDSLVCKVIVWAKHRQAAIKRMQKALSELEIEGIQTTTPFHMQVLEHPDFINGNIHTHFLDKL
jgi:acetyl-CoA carboxylase biotin carboxylase subunit